MRAMGDREHFLAEAMERQRQAVDSLRPDSDASADGALTRWMAVERQANTFLRHLQPQLARGDAAVLHHRGELEQRAATARAQVEGFGESPRAHSRAGLGLRLAVMGKGGAGKTFITSVLARSLARQGRRVLAVDLDTNPGLALSLGVPSSATGLPEDAVEQHPGAAYGWRLAVSPAEAVDRFSFEGPDGVRFLGLGKIGSVDKEAPKRSVEALVQILLGFGVPGWDVIADMEAGPTTPFERYHSFSDKVMVVVGPAWRSAMTARRLLTLVGPRPSAIVANRFRDEPDHPGLGPPLARIPFDADVREAERRGLAPIDACPDAPAVDAVRQLAHHHLIKEAVA